MRPARYFFVIQLSNSRVCRGGLALPGNCGSSFGTGLQGHGPAGNQHTIFADGPYFLL